VYEIARRGLVDIKMESLRDLTECMLQLETTFLKTFSKLMPFLELFGESR